jgi:hypothetical protein
MSRRGPAMFLVAGLVARKKLHPSEIDWCIPMAYDGAPEVDRLGWKVGFCEGWSDSFVAFRLRFDGAFREFFADVARVRKLVIAERGQVTASLVGQLDRNLSAIARFTGPA